MKRKWPASEEQYFGIGVYRPKRSVNIGTLWRTASILGAQFIFTIEGRYKQQPSDTDKSWAKIPLFQFDSFEAFHAAMPYSCPLIGVELDKEAQFLNEFKHPPRATYLLGAEDAGLPKAVLERCHQLIKLPGESSLNVAVAGSIVLYDRIVKTS